MDNQWHHQAVQGNICPICSISHFPFCAPHPSLNSNPRYASPHDQWFRGPGFDPYRGSYHPYDGYRDPSSWHRNPNLGRDSSDGYDVYNATHVDGYANMPYDYSSFNGFTSGGGDRNNKRMRVDETGSVGLVDECQSRLVSEQNERRLKLIRDHGCASSGLPPSGANSIVGTGMGFNRESAVSESKFGYTGFGKHGNFNDLRVNGEPAGNMGISNFRDAGFDSGERRGPFLHSDNVLSSHSSKEDRSLAFEQQSTQVNRSGQNDIPIEQGHRSHEIMAQRGTDWGNPYHQSSQKGDLNQESRISQYDPYPIPELPNVNYPETEQRSSISMENWESNNQTLYPYTLQHSRHMKHNFHSPSSLNDTRQSSEVKLLSREGNQFPVGHPVTAQYSPPNNSSQGGYLPFHIGRSMVPENLAQLHASGVFNLQPPLPTSPPPPLPVDLPGKTVPELKASYLPPKTVSSMFPHPEAHYSSQSYFHNKPHLPVSSSFAVEESHALRQTSSQQYLGEGQLFPLKQLRSDKPKIIDASLLFKQPHRAARPDHIVIILRGLPGSGKSYLAKVLRDLEVEKGGDAPRIHSMDDYFMTEVERVDESERTKSTSSGRGKKPTVKKVMEYCYEPEMEEAYRSSMLKAFKKTLEEGVFTFIIVDDRNLRVADFAQFWAIAKRSGYEVYLLEATYKDPVGCAARNVHGFTQDEIQRMAGQWEEAPSMYLQLDAKSLFHGDDLKESEIQEVDMDMDDRDFDEGLSGSQVKNTVVSPPGDHATAGSLKDVERWNGDSAEGNHPAEEVKELGRSKWSDDLDEDDAERTHGAKGNLSSLSGLIQAYETKGKSVQWGDQVGNTGFAIGAAKKAKVLSLVIGPGAGYNLKSNPFSDEANPTTPPTNTGESKGQGIFQERLRAERESSKAIFERRRHRVGVNVEEE